MLFWDVLEQILCSHDGTNQVNSSQSYGDQYEPEIVFEKHYRISAKWLFDLFEYNM